VVGWISLSPVQSSEDISSAVVGGRVGYKYSSNSVGSALGVAEAALGEYGSLVVLFGANVGNG